MKDADSNSILRSIFGYGLAKVLLGVCSGAGLMSIAIAWRVIHRPHGASFFPILGWQLLIWLPWVGYYYAVRYLVRRLGTYQDASLIGLAQHIFAALAIASTHLIWYWQISSNATTERFAVRKGRSQHLIRAADIRWIEAQGYYAALHKCAFSSQNQDRYNPELRVFTILLLLADSVSSAQPLFVANQHLHIREGES